MQIFEIDYVANATKLERFLEDLLSYLEGGARPMVFHGSAEHTQKERAIVHKISTMIEDYEKLKLQIRTAEQRPWANKYEKKVENGRNDETA